MANGRLVDEYKLTEDEEWSYMVNDLDKYDSLGNLIEYSIAEDDTDEYTIIDTSSIDSDELIELTSTSKHRRVVEPNRNVTEDENNNTRDVKGATEENPKPGDNIIIYITLLIISIVGIVSSKLYIKKNG